MAARNAIPLTAVGVTDDHDGTDWRAGRDRNVTLGRPRPAGTTWSRRCAPGRRGSPT
ncbi:hypothetical protein V2I01_36795 [Micromonospora sp. BRA006-A]|nr:hypothetical protein [Micromonospora sp. BRA006-A]